MPDISVDTLPKIHSSAPARDTLQGRIKAQTGTCHINTPLAVQLGHIGKCDFTWRPHVDPGGLLDPLDPPVVSLW